MKLVNENGTVNTLEFTCNKTKERYRILASKNSHTGNHWHDNAFKSIDLVKKMSTGKLKTFTREEVSERFNDISL